MKREGNVMHDVETLRVPDAEIAHLAASPKAPAMPGVVATLAPSFRPRCPARCLPSPAFRLVIMHDQVGMARQTGHPIGQRLSIAPPAEHHTGVTERAARRDWSRPLIERRT